MAGDRHFGRVVRPFVRRVKIAPAPRPRTMRPGLPAGPAAAGLLLLLLLLTGLGTPSTATLGAAGGSIVVESDIQILSGHGGGHVTYRINGPVTQEIRIIIDDGYGDRDGNIRPSEAEAFTARVDRNIEGSRPQFHGADVTNAALLNKNIETDTQGLLGSTSETSGIEIYFLLKANVIVRETRLELSNVAMVRALLDALEDVSRPGDENGTFLGTVELHHSTIIVGQESFSDPRIAGSGDGRVIRSRFPATEAYRYDRTYSGSFPLLQEDKQPAPDTIRYAPFDPVQNSTELFIIYLVCTILIVVLPRRFMYDNARDKVRWVHSLGWGWVAILSFLFFLAVDGLWVVVVAPALAIAHSGLSYRVYAKGWLATDSPAMQRRLAEAEARGRRQASLGASEDITPEEDAARGAAEEDGESAPPQAGDWTEEQRQDEAALGEVYYEPDPPRRGEPPVAPSWPAPESEPPVAEYEEPPTPAPEQRAPVATAPPPPLRPPPAPTVPSPAVSVGRVDRVPPPRALAATRLATLPPKRQEQPPLPAPVPAAARTREVPIVEGDWDAPAPPRAPPPAVAPHRAAVPPRPAASPAMQPPRTTAPATGIPKKVRCASCKTIFSVTVVQRPMTIVCPICGSQGLLP